MTRSSHCPHCAAQPVADLRAEHEFNLAASAGPMTDAVLEPHQRALQLAQDAILSRVTALERYAAEIVKWDSGSSWKAAGQLSRATADPVLPVIQGERGGVIAGERG